MDFDTVAIAHDDQCDLGKRIYGDGQGCCSGYPEYGRLRNKHADFHKCAAGDGDWAEF
ncbi:MAG TPA: CZB domain-containing protein [Parasulfuritortus sp.]